MGLFSPPDVDKLYAEGSIEGLIRAAKHRDSEVAAKASAALADMTDFCVSELSTKNIRRLQIVREALVLAGEPAVDAMIFVHTDKQSLHRRQDVTFVLGEAGDPKAVPVLIDALRDTDPLLRKLAAEALGKIGDPQAERPVHLVAMNDDNPQVKKAARKAYERIKAKK